MWEKYKERLQNAASWASFVVADQLSSSQQFRHLIGYTENQALEYERKIHEKTKQTLEAAFQRIAQLEEENQSLKKDRQKKDEFLKQLQVLQTARKSSFASKQ